MNDERVKNLEQWIRDDPNEPFNKYALAIELGETSNESVESLFNELLALHPDYLPTYYMAARFFLKLHRQEKAIPILKSGIDVATKQMNLKTKRELASLLDELLFE